MLNLITAVPGSGKTLFVVDKLKNETKRPIYYHGIPELKLPWTQLKNPDKWPSEVPDNSIIVIDECQKIFPTRDHKVKKPLGVEALEDHRHRGIDLYFITQHPSMLDIHVRRLAGCHIHLVRNFGFERSTKHVSNKYTDPDNYHEMLKAEKTIFSFPKSSYGLYKSAEQHTHKRHIPKVLYFIPFGIALLFYLIYNIYDRFDNNPVMAAHTPTENIISSAPYALGASDKILIVANDFKETIKGVPGSAPVYQELWKPVSIPKLSCISSISKCLCYTEQGTRYFIDEISCRKRIEFGVYDFTQSNKVVQNTQKPSKNNSKSTTM